MKSALDGGRGFNEQNSADSEKVVIINEKAARRLWPGQNAIGQMGKFNNERRVVGVVGNVRHQAIEQEGEMEGYLPITQASMGSVEWVVARWRELPALAPRVGTVSGSVGA